MITVTSPAFAHEGAIPATFTCDGVDRSPALAWTPGPPATRSYVLIVDDPDAPDPAAPRRIWVHWVRYNMPAEVLQLPEGDGNATSRLGDDAITDAGTPGYHGPCPPIGRHRYYFRVFALDCLLPHLGANARRTDLERAMHGHVLDTGVLLGVYERPGAR